MSAVWLKCGRNFLAFRSASLALKRLGGCRLISRHFQRGVTNWVVEQHHRVVRSTLSNLSCHQWRQFRVSASLGCDALIVVETPAFAESISDGDIKWDKAVGDAVAEDEQVGEIETDKTTIPVNAPAAGIISELLVEDGDKVTPGTKLFKLQVGDATAKSTAQTPKAPKPSPPAPEMPRPSPFAPPPLQDSPVPTEMPAFPSQIPPLPTGPMATITPSPPPPPRTPSISELNSNGGLRTEHREKMSRMRQRIAERLKGAQNELAMLTTFNEIDMSNVIEMRKKHGEAFLKKHGLKLGFMSPFVKAAVFALQDQPIVNAVIEGKEIKYRDYCDISIAVASPKGLVVPVLRNCETMTFADVEKAIYELGVKARDGTLAIEDMEGGTFTISNGGVFGSLFGTPIINPPQSAILGMHATVERPIAVNGKVEIRPMMYVALTYDHRLIDGREAVTFLKKIKAAVEDPRVLLIDL